MPGRIALLVLGDSFAAGASTTQERMFSSLLAGRLGGRVYNLGFPGGPYDQYLNLAIEWPRLPLAPSAGLVWTFFEVLVRTLPDGRAMLFSGKQEAWGRRARTEVEAHPNFSKLERTLAAVSRLTRERGLAVTVLILPTKGEVYRWVLDGKPAPSWEAPPSGFVQAVLPACDRAGLRCLDAKPFLVEEARRRYESSGLLLWWRDDTHLGECGHEAVARFIAERVLDVRDCGVQGGAACPVSVSPSESGGRSGSGFRLPPE